MAETIQLPDDQDATIYINADWDQVQFIFYDDIAETIPTDFTGQVFTGQVLTKKKGTKLFDLTFNTPTSDGQILPSLTEAQTLTISGKKLHYWVKVDGSAYYSGSLEVSSAFVAGL
jgi:hypothetical protein